MKKMIAASGWRKMNQSSSEPLCASTIFGSESVPVRMMMPTTESVSGIS